MKKLISGILLIAMLFTLCACSEESSGSEAKSNQPTAPVDNYNYPTINQKLTWEAINAFPIKSENMTEDEMRDLCVNFFRFAKTALWIPNDNWEFVKTNSGTIDNLYKGNIYGGLPYIPVASGSIYRLMDYINEETGVVDMTEPMQNPKLFGNQCSIGAYWGWSRVINSTNYSWTYLMVERNGFLRVGPYTYDDNLLRFEDGVYTTTDVINENGPEVMFQSYAAMKRADGLVNYTTAGHTMMCSSDPVVVYNADGTIDGAQSYLTIIDQHVDWSTATNEAGDEYQHKNYVDRKFTFNQLMADSYIPFTFAEFQGTDPIEATECTFSHTGDTITVEQLVKGTVTANYGISDCYAVLKDADGNEVIRGVKRSETAGVMEQNFIKAVDMTLWSEYTDGSYTVEVFCQLGTGERPTIYTGTLVG